jgi:hypothetical protein
VKKGRLREYSYGDMLFNYGCFPQTWEDPSHTTPDTAAIGDNDPIDAMEIGTQIASSGAVVRPPDCMLMSSAHPTNRRHADRLDRSGRARQGARMPRHD